MARSRNGHAIPPERRTVEAVAALEAFAAESRKVGKVDAWVRARAMLNYIAGERVADIARNLGKGRTTINNWLLWYAREGCEGLRSAPRGRSVSRLDAAKRTELSAIIEGGPLEAGLTSAMWTGKVLAVVIQERFGVSYHPQSVPRLLHELGFSVQRPRKRLSRADAEKQAAWVEHRLPEVKKSPGMRRGSRLGGRGQLLGRRHAAPNLVTRRRATSRPDAR